MISSGIKNLKHQLLIFRLKLELWRLKLMGKGPDYYRRMFMGMGLAESFKPTASGYVRSYTDGDIITFHVEVDKK